METVKTHSGEDLHLSLDALLGSPHDRILYMYLCQHGLEAVYNVIADIYKYKRQPDAAKRQEQAEAMVRSHLMPPDARLAICLDGGLLTTLLDAVDQRTTTLDMWHELDKRIKATLEWSTFFGSDMFGDFCNAIRERYPLSLHDVLGECNPVKLRFLEQWLLEFNPSGVTNLLFYVDVQTTFAPLVSPSMTFSLSLFEEIQVTVRRLFNVYLAENNASIVSDDTKKDVLSRILMYQGEPFSPQRYVTLFKGAQDQVLKWLSAKIFPNFKNSLHCIQLLVELAWLDDDVLCRKACAPKRDAKHVLLLPLSPPSVDEPCALPKGFCIESTLHATEYAVVCATDALLDLHVVVFGVGVAPAQTTSTTFYATLGETAFQYEYYLCCGADDGHDDIKQFCLVRDRLPVVLRPRRSGSEAPRVHAFAVPTPTGTRYGLCFTTWTVNKTIDPDQLVFLPTFTCVLTSTSFWHLAPFLQASLPSIPHDTNDASVWVKAVEDAHRQYHEAQQRQREIVLQPPYRAFTLHMQLAPAQAADDVPSALFRDLNVQNIVLALTALLVEHRVILIARQRDTLFTGAESLLRLFAPFRFKHTYLPFCPTNVAAQLKHEGPLLIGLEAAIHLRRAESHTHRIRSSLSNLQRANVVLKTPDESFTYPSELYATRTVLVDLDHDEVYTPFKQDLPELPLAKVRRLELALRAVQHPQLANADTYLFTPPPSVGAAVADVVSPSSLPDVKASDALCVCFLGFLTSLFGSVTQHLATIPNTIDLGKHKPALQHVRHNQPDAPFYDQFLAFDAEGFLDAHMEMGCRDFFRQVFATEAFHEFLRRQRQRFVPNQTSPTSSDDKDA
ncbi:hypothetical protein SPRG_00699 [Saprolegnia parasitica CBS 223.65]|uniref:UDENN domain-containing protein n=1 Tax=Saprolegnia parasitica (strain CBS 223.65) TaxID=695850 RepID=A0A067D6L2_SAPPC|nr:hypothetical protein SPRG_00699 [Saprolegnia parasitica CBS 223.65]KDO34637.1 hypothetical protein SPRG_00699 [Saprolegnia parasitica CBS 223.65]|eukprot:XP_012194312.1 hypothetical protein SPRG_00699 [Saprolegnia parasitica CBS 223.65]